MKPKAELRTIEDFVVEEELKQKFKKSFMRTKGGVKKMTGHFFLHKLEKQNLTTFEALEEIGSDQDIGYAGLKDKKAITKQYITIKNNKINIEKSNLKIIFLRKIKNHLSLGDLKYNKFSIILHNYSNSKFKSTIEKINENGFLNYFGPQRFGVDNNNHESGRKIVRNGNSGHSKKLTKFLIHAYQSWVFNRALDVYDDPPNELPLVGNKTELDPVSKQLLEEDGVKKEDFELGNLSCRGGYRATRVYTNIKYKIEKKAVVLNFKLPPGSYATVLLNNIFTVKDLR